MRAFLSHASSDKEGYVRIVAAHLTDENVVFDEISFEAGEQTLDEIVRGLDDSDLFALFISDKALDSPWVQKEVTAAELRFASGALKAIYPIIIDRKITHEDPRIPKWLKDNFNLRLLPRPVIAARRIHQKLRQLSWSKHPQLKARQNVFIGRNLPIEAFERRFDDFTKTKPVLSVVGGAPSIGRRTLIKNALRKLALSAADREFPIVYLDRHASIEDFISKILDLGASESTYVDLELAEKDVNEKIRIAVRLLQELLPLGERVVILDEGCLVNYKHELSGWFERIVKDDSIRGKPLLFVAARWTLSPQVARALDGQVFSCVLGELDDSERRRLLGRLLEIESIALNSADFETFASLLHGFPDEVYFTVDLISRFGVAGAIARSNEIVEFNSEKATLLLRKFEGNEAILNVIRLLAQSEVFSIAFLCEVFKEVELSAVVADLASEHICEFVGLEGEFVRLIDSVRDYVKRNNLELAPELKSAVRAAVKKDVDEARWSEYDSSRVAFVVRESLASGANLDPKVLIPSHVLRTMRDLYNKRGNLKRLVGLADALLLKERNLESQLCQDVRYFLCIGLARLRDKRVLEEVQKISGPEHDFILGYYYRLTGRHRDAIERLSKVTSAPFVGARAKRELVEVLLLTEQFDEARSLSEKNYKENRTNQFHIQAYFRSLVLGSAPEKHREKLVALCDELDAVGSEQSRQMAMIGRAQIAARCAHDRRALQLIDDAIAAFPEVVYPVLAKFDIALIFREELGMSDALSRLGAFAKEEKSLSQRTLSLQRAYFEAFKGNLDSALREVDSLVRNYPEEAYKRLVEKLRVLSSQSAGAPSN